MSLDHAAKLVKQQKVTCDAFLGGRLRLWQPVKGFRAGLDSVLLGAAVSVRSGTILDLGAGVGTAALVALFWNEASKAVLVEDDAEALVLARCNIEANGLSGRAEAIDVDIGAGGRHRRESGLAADSYAAVIANPPFFDSARGTAPAPARGRARQMEADALELWAKAAAMHAAPGAEIIFILPAASTAALLTAFASRFGAITLLPLCPREGVPASRLLVRGIKGSRAPLTLLASRTVHEPQGRAFQPEFEAILRGEARLDW